MRIKGTVEKFVTIDPKRIKLKGKPGEQLKMSAEIIPEKKYPFKIIAGKAKKGEFIDFKLEEAEDRKKYLLTVENQKKDEGRYFDSIVLKTDSKIRPELTIRVFGEIVKPKDAKSGDAEGKTKPKAEKKPS